MIYAVIEDNVVANIVIGPDSWVPKNMIIAPSGPGCVVGGTYKDGSFTAPAEQALTLEQARQYKLATLSQACQHAIYEGFTSDALGSNHAYPADDKSQFNLTASVTDSLLPNLPANWTTPLMCADSSGVWAMRPHTAAQIQQAGSDGKAFVLKNLQQNESLAAQVAAAATVAAVQAIVWTNPA